MTATATVLIVEDEVPHGQAIAEGLDKIAMHCTVVDSGRAAIAAIAERPFDVVITDYKLGDDVDGMEVLRHAKSRWPECEVILITAHGSEELVRQTLMLEKGFDYLTKPIDLEALRGLVTRAAAQAQSNRQSMLIRRQLTSTEGFDNIIGRSPAMQRILKIVRQIAPTNVTVLLLGESGTGKDLLANAIHQASPRRDRRMVTLDCAGLSEGVLESELFGHVKGAFTGAIAARKGRFEYADGSTLFLDEIGEMPLTMQAKLLRALENREIVPVGSNEPMSIDVRLISATNRNLPQAVEKGDFREDLFFRLKTITLRIPPLRERREDIPFMIEKFVRVFNTQHSKHIESMTPRARDILTAYAWPGNVRELRNTLESMVVLAESKELDVHDIPDEILSQVPEEKTTAIVPLTSLVGRTLEDLEREHIRNTLQITQGNREQAAKILGIAPRTLYRKLKEYNLE